MESSIWRLFSQMLILFNKIKPKKIIAMKTLIMILIPLTLFGQLRQPNKHMMPPDMFKPTGQTIEPKFAAVIVLETGLLLASSYFIAQNNQKAYRVARNAFLISTVPVFCLTLSLDKPKRKKFR